MRLFSFLRPCSCSDSPFLPFLSFFSPPSLSPHEFLLLRASPRQDQLLVRELGCLVPDEDGPVDASLLPVTPAPPSFSDLPDEAFFLKRPNPRFLVWEEDSGLAFFLVFEALASGSG